MALIGYEGYFYVSLQLLTADLTTPATPTTAQTILDTSVAPATLQGWNDVSDIIDVTPDTADEKVETTTRGLARVGAKGEKTIFTGGTINFTMSNELMTYQSMLHHLVKAGDAQAKLSILILNKDIDTVGAWGRCGLYSLNVPNATQQLKAHQVLNFSATLDSFADNCIITTIAAAPSIIKISNFTGVPT